MAQLDTNQVEQLIAEGKLQEAKQMLDAYLDSDLTPEEKGATYADFARLYLRVSTALNKQYAAVLDDAMAVLNDIDKEKEEAEKQVDITQARNQIQQL